MDEQLRNRFRRYDSGSAPLRPRPNAPSTRPASPPLQQQPPTAPLLGRHTPPPKQQLPPDTPKVQPSPGPAPTSRREPIPERPSIARPAPRPQAAQRAPQPARAKKKRSRKRGRKVFATLLVLIILAGGVAAGYWFGLKPRLDRKAAPAQSSTANQAAEKKPGKLVRLVAVGDSMNYTSINQAAQSGGSYNYVSLMSAIKPLMAKASIRICSQTVPSTPTQPVSGPATFNAPAQFATGLKEIGCNVMDLASPNANDKGQAGVDGSIGNFDKQADILAFAGVNRTAEEQNTIRYFTIEDVKFAYLSYTMNSNVAASAPHSVNVYSDELADKQVKEARDKANIIIVSMHWGTDQAADQNADQEAVAQHLATLNADIVIGNGPHVIQPVKVLTGTNNHQTLVWFSLGNFLNSQVPLETVIGGMAVMDIDSSTHELHDPRILPLYMHYEWTPEQKVRHSDPDLLARKNFQLVPLDKAADLLAKSQNNTTVQAQQERVKGIVNKYFTVPVMTSDEL